MSNAMSNADMWSLVVGFLSATFVLPIIQQPRWNELTRSLTTFGYSLVAGFGTAWFTGALDSTSLQDAKSVTSAMLLVFVSAIATYKGFATPTGIAPAIEKATSAGGTPKPGSEKPLTSGGSDLRIPPATEQPTTTAASGISPGISRRPAHRAGSDPASAFRTR